MKQISNGEDQSQELPLLKEQWGDGPWQAEEDFYSWLDGHTGLPCMAIRNMHTGAWCGYVGVEVDSPWFGKQYNEDGPMPLVHGGVTFTGPIDRKDRHIPNDVDCDGLWFIGFDCAHGHDKMPGHEATMRVIMPDEVLFALPGAGYRDINFVIEQCTSMARQISLGYGQLPVDEELEDVPDQ